MAEAATTGGMSAGASQSLARLCAANRLGSPLPVFDAHVIWVAGGDPRDPEGLVYPRVCAAILIGTPSRLADLGKLGRPLLCEAV